MRFWDPSSCGSDSRVSTCWVNVRHRQRHSLINTYSALTCPVLGWILHTWHQTPGRTLRSADCLGLWNPRAWNAAPPQPGELLLILRTSPGVTSSPKFPLMFPLHGGFVSVLCLSLSHHGTLNQSLCLTHTHTHTAVTFCGISLLTCQSPASMRIPWGF